MRRMLLVSTTMLALATAPGLAQQADDATMPAPAADAPAAAGDAPMATGSAPEPVPEQGEHQVRAQSLLGVDVTNGQETIGKISDLVVTEDGQVEAIVVGIGGFLGIGQKRVALAWDSVQMTRQDNERFFVVSATREQLEAMPEFRTLEEKEAEAAAAASQQQMQQEQEAMPGAGIPAEPAAGSQ